MCGGLESVRPARDVFVPQLLSTTPSEAAPLLRRSTKVWWEVIVSEDKAFNFSNSSWAMVPSLTGITVPREGGEHPDVTATDVNMGSVEVIRLVLPQEPL